MRRQRDPSEIKAGRETVRFAWLLATLVAALALPPLLLAARLDIASLRIGLSAVLIASLVLLSRNRRMFWFGLGLAIPALVFDWGSLIAGSLGLAMAASATSIAFLGLITWRIVDSLLRTERVTSDTILGGICVYLLVGILWVSAFNLVENFHPGSLLLDGQPLSAVASQAEPFRYPELLYFSFVTLTTLGYGDIIPVVPAARALAAGEAIFGQLYVTIFVARLVGLHLAHARSRS